MIGPNGMLICYSCQHGSHNCWWPNVVPCDCETCRELAHHPEGGSKLVGEGIYLFWLAVSVFAFGFLIDQVKGRTNYQAIAEWVREHGTRG